MLAKIASTANLKASQISVKSGIPRSQAYAMIKPSPVLPSKPDQVRAFLRVCNVAPAQIEEVLQLWSQLAEEATTSSETGSSAEAVRSVLVTDAINNFLGTVATSDTLTVGVQQPVYYRRGRHLAAVELVGLVRHVVSDERRTSRAMRLLTRVGMMQIPPLLFVAYLITRLPEAVAMWIAAAIVTLLVTALVAGVFMLRNMLREQQLDL